MIIRVIVLITIVASVLDCHGQDSGTTTTLNKDRYLIFGIGTMAVRLNDEHMSPLNYKGGGFHLNLGAFKRKNGTIRNFELGAMLGSISPKEDNREVNPNGQYYRLDMSYNQQYFIKPVFRGKLRWYSGGKIKSHTNVRLNQQLDTGFITFVLANGLFFSNTLEGEVKVLSRMAILSWQVDVPIINHVIRPSFLNVFDYVNPEGNWVQERVEDSDWFAINKYSNITSTVSMLYPISTSNILRLTYSWDFYRVSSDLPATSATGLLSFSFLFKY